jgi:hypothetical protein
MIKTQEINFKCHNCEHDIQYEQSQCRICGLTLEWEETLRLDYADKFLEIYTVYV